MREFINIVEGQGMALYHVTPTINIPSIMRDGLVPQVGDRSTAMAETPAIYLFPSREHAEDAVMNWLGDEFEDVPLTLLKVSVDPSIIQRSGADYEVTIHHTIDPNAIENVGEL